MPSRVALRYFMRDGVASSARLGITQTYSIPFALALGASAGQVGLLAALPRLAETAVQPAAAALTEATGRRKLIHNTAALASRLLWIPILLIPLLGGGVWAFIAILAVSSAAAGFSVPAWASWFSDLVPEQARGRYFGRRAAAAGLAALATTLAAGWLLGLINGLLGFSAIFALALGLGLLSSWYLARIPELPFRRHVGHGFALNPGSFIREFRGHRNFANFALLMCGLSFSIFLAAPFFAVYMLRDLGIGYGWYAAAAATFVAVSTLSLPYWGKLADRWGDRAVLLLCGACVVVYPLLWLAASSIWHVLAIMAWDGFFWSGFSLTTFNYLLDVTPITKRPSYVANYNLLTGLALVAGPAVGGGLAEAIGGGAVAGLVGLHVLFFISFVLRLCCVGLLPILSEERVRGRAVPGGLFFKALTVWPAKEIASELAWVGHCLICWERAAAKRLRAML